MINLRQVHLSFGHAPLLDHVSVQIEPGEHICLIGQNGAGKSTFLKLIQAKIEPDAGYVAIPAEIKLSELPQTVPQDLSGTVYEVVSQGLGDLGSLLQQFEKINVQLAESASDDLLQQLERVQHEIDLKNGWVIHQRIMRVLTQTGLAADEDVKSLSGGQVRRALLARALVVDPDVLILDEPTNHLDIESIIWLENFLKNYPKTVVFVSHDRAFMQAVATRIFELDNGHLLSWSGKYEDFLKHKEMLLAAEATEQALFDKKLAQEEVWIRQGIKARRTRNEGRVRALKKMREERSQRRDRRGNMKIADQKIGEATGKIVFEAEQVSYQYESKPIINNLNVSIQRGDRIGIIGPNGCGKTTLLKLLLGKLEPNSGKVKQGSKIELAYFDQHRAILDDEKTLVENVGEGSDQVIINGTPKHVIGYLQDFLFSPQRARSKVKGLSGGERNRLLLAKLFTKPANVLVLDEPTNDLDVETLELLEEYLLNYQGTLLLISHDREFINNIVTSTLVFEGEGKVAEYVGGYDDWLRQRASLSQPLKVAAKERATNKPGQKKLSYKEARELELLPEKIAKLESRIADLHNTMAEAGFYQQEKQEITVTQKDLQEAEEALQKAYERWEQLEQSK